MIRRRISSRSSPSGEDESESVAGGRVSGLPPSLDARGYGGTAPTGSCHGVSALKSAIGTDASEL